MFGNLPWVAEAENQTGCAQAIRHGGVQRITSIKSSGTRQQARVQAKFQLWTDVKGLSDGGIVHCGG
jgi:hypothetical protein